MSVTKFLTQGDDNSGQSSNEASKSASTNDSNDDCAASSNETSCNEYIIQEITIIGEIPADGGASTDSMKERLLVIDKQRVLDEFIRHVSEPLKHAVLTMVESDENRDKLQGTRRNMDILAKMNPILQTGLPLKSTELVATELNRMQNNKREGAKLCDEALMKMQQVKDAAKVLMLPKSLGGTAQFDPNQGGKTHHDLKMPLAEYIRSEPTPTAGKPTKATSKTETASKPHSKHMVDDALRTERMIETKHVDMAKSKSKPEKPTNDSQPQNIPSPVQNTLSNDEKVGVVDELPSETRAKSFEIPQGTTASQLTGATYTETETPTAEVTPEEDLQSIVLKIMNGVDQIFLKKF